MLRALRGGAPDVQLRAERIEGDGPASCDGGAIRARDGRTIGEGVTAQHAGIGRAAPCARAGDETPAARPHGARWTLAGAKRRARPRAE